MFRLLKGPAMGLAVGALAFVLAACGSSGGSSDSKAGPTTAVTLKGTSTGKNTASATAGGITAAGARQPMAVFPYAQYALFCVTFTNPPSAGTGNFDAAGTFSVTVSNAAGVPVGCFIVDTSNQNHTVATLTFTIGSAGGMDPGTSTGAVFPAGTCTIDIQFDVGTGVASATVTTGCAPSTGGTTTLAAADLAGSWQMYCDLGNALPDLAACGRAMGGLSIPELFLDPITATDSVQGVLYALGAWPSAVAFTAAGGTEGMAMTLPGTLTTPVTSLLGPSTPGWGAAAPNPQTKFPGFTSDVTAAYDYNTNTMGDVQLWNWMVAHLTHLDLTTSWVNQACYSTANSGPILATSVANAWPVFSWPASGAATPAQKQCLLQYISVAAEKDRSNTLTGGPFYIPRPLGSNWSNYAGITQNALTSLVFDGSQIGGSPNVSPRFALMGLEFSGNSAMATETGVDTYTRQWWNGSITVNDTCTEVHYTNINLVNTGTGTFDGYFSTGESQTCSASTSSNSTSNSTFKVKMVRPGAMLPFGTLAPVLSNGGTHALDGTWIQCRTGTTDIAESFSIAGGTIVYAQTAHPSNGKCGSGELGQLQVVIVGTLAAGGTQTIVWSDGVTSPAAAPTLNAGGAIAATTASKVLATVTAAYTSNPSTNPVPAIGGTHGLVFFMDDSTGGGNPLKLYRDNQSPASCVGTSASGGYAACLDITPMVPRN